MKPIYYMQTDPKWSKIPYTSTNNRTQTIGSSGCGTTCMAMILSTWIDPTILPDYTSKLAVDNKFRTVNSGTDYGFFKFCSNKYNLELEETFKTDRAIELIKQGYLVVCSMGPGYFTKFGHYILAYDFDGTNIIVHDPAHPERTKASIDIFKQQSLRYFAFKKKEEIIMPEVKVNYDENEFQGYIKAMKEHGIIDFDSNHKPDEPVTWFALAKVTAKILGYK